MARPSDAGPITDWTDECDGSHSVPVTDDRGRVWVVNVKLDELGGRMEPSALSVYSQGSPITRDVMKAIPFGGIVSAARARERAGMKSLFDDTRWADGMDDIYGPSRGRRLGDDELELVAVTYREAFTAGRPVVAAVAEVCGISTSAAAKRIRAARDAGLLAEVSR